MSFTAFNSSLYCVCYVLLLQEECGSIFFLSFISSLALYAGAAGFILLSEYRLYGFWLNLENSYIAAAVSLAFSGISDFSVLKFFLAAAVQFAVFYVVGYLSFKKERRRLLKTSFQVSCCRLF